MDTLIERRIAQFTDPVARVGATYRPGEGVYIRLWAPKFKSAAILWQDAEPVPLKRDEDGYFTGFFPERKPGDRYFFLGDDNKIADPASRYQPEGVFGPSAVVAEDYAWTDQNWRGLTYETWVIYEIHTGTFSAGHDFTGIIADLTRLKRLGITTLEIMPVSQFSGTRNWGYDGVFPHAVHDSYGGPAGLKALVDACHAQGLAIILDVVYNHIGPEGNVLFSCAPYTQTKYKTPWGEAINVDGADSDHVRRYLLQSAWQWLTEYHFDGLRLDAVQTIFDTAPITFLEELARLKKQAEHVTKRNLVLIAESDMNDSRLLQPVEKNGLGMDGQWADDLHHALHATLTGDKSGYYEDYGGVAQLAKIYQRGMAYEGEYSPFRRRFHGRSYEGIHKNRLVVESQNHDQIGNRLLGERLSVLLSPEKLKLAAACVLLSPFMPFLFMGEEWGEKSPFLYFISHQDPKLMAAVRDGRREEWKSFGWTEEPPDPGAPETFDRCVLPARDFAEGSDKAALQVYYQRLIALSKRLRSQALQVECDAEKSLIVLRYGANDIVYFSFSEKTVAYAAPDDREWSCVLSSATLTQDQTVSAPAALTPFSATVFSKI